LVHPGLLHTSTAVSLGDIASPISAVQAGAVTSTISAPQPPRIQTQACRAHSVLPDVLENSDWQHTNSAAPYFLHSLPNPEFRWKQQIELLLLILWNCLSQKICII
ncbi:unnamed protein product, partial [Staurois parvus]